MGLFGTQADLWSDALLLVEIGITVGVVLGIWWIRHDRVARHRATMLTLLVANAAFLLAFLVQDALAAATTVSRATHAPAHVFWPTLAVHLAFAFSGFTVAVVAWRRVRTGAGRGPEGRWQVDGDARRRHRRWARLYPYLWAGTLVTGILLYQIVYVIYA